MDVAPWTRLNGWMGLDISGWGEVYGKGANNFSDVGSILFTEFKLSYISPVSAFPRLPQRR